MTTSNVIVEIQKSLQGLSQAIGRVEGKIDGFTRSHVHQETRIDALEGRTSKVENRQHWYSGVGAALGILIGKFVPGLFGHS